MLNWWQGDCFWASYLFETHNGWIWHAGWIKVTPVFRAKKVTHSSLQTQPLLMPEKLGEKNWTFWHLQMGVPLSSYLFVEKLGGVFVGPKEMKNASSWSIRAQEFRKIPPKQHRSLKGKKKRFFPTLLVIGVFVSMDVFTDQISLREFDDSGRKRRTFPGPQCQPPPKK